MISYSIRFSTQNTLTADRQFWNVPTGNAITHGITTRCQCGWIWSFFGKVRQITFVSSISRFHSKIHTGLQWFDTVSTIYVTCLDQKWICKWSMTVPYVDWIRKRKARVIAVTNIDLFIEWFTELSILWLCCWFFYVLPSIGSFQVTFEFYAL